MNDQSCTIAKVSQLESAEILLDGRMMDGNDINHTLGYDLLLGYGQQDRQPQDIVASSLTEQGFFSFDWQYIISNLTAESVANIVLPIKKSCLNGSSNCPDIDIFVTPFSPTQVAKILGLSAEDFLMKAMQRGVTPSCPHPCDHLGLHKFFTVVDAFSVVYEGPVPPLAVGTAFAFNIPEQASAVLSINLEVLYELLPDLCEELSFESRKPVIEADACRYTFGLILITGLFLDYVRCSTLLHNPSVSVP